MVSGTQDVVQNGQVDIGGVGWDVASNLGGGTVAAPYQLLEKQLPKNTSKFGLRLIETNGALVSGMVGLGISTGGNHHSTNSNNNSNSGSNHTPSGSNSSDSSSSSGSQSALYSYTMTYGLDAGVQAVELANKLGITF